MFDRIQLGSHLVPDFVGRFLITVSISLLVIGLFVFSFSSWFSLGRLSISKNLSLSSRLSIFWAWSCSWYTAQWDRVRLVKAKPSRPAGGFLVSHFSRSSFNSSGDDLGDSYEAEDVRLETRYSWIEFCLEIIIDTIFSLLQNFMCFWCGVLWDLFLWCHRLCSFEEL